MRAESNPPHANHPELRNYLFNFNDLNMLRMHTKNSPCITYYISTAGADKRK